MGLGLYVGGKRVAGWSYSGFHQFRKKLARAIGIELDQMEGFYTDETKKILETKGWEDYHAAIEEDLRRPKISWDTVKDPIKLLLHHSDCEGILTPEECAQVGPRLRQIVENWEDTMHLVLDADARQALPHYPPEMHLDNYDKVNALSLADGMEEAARTGQDLEFC